MKFVEYYNLLLIADTVYDILLMKLQQSNSYLKYWISVLSKKNLIDDAMKYDFPFTFRNMDIIGL